MKRCVFGGAALALLLWSAGPATAGMLSNYSGQTGNLGGGGGGPGDPTYAFTYSDNSGNAGFGEVNAVPAGLGDDGLWAVSGSLTVTSGAEVGTYSLLSVGPGITVLPSTTPGITWFVDNLIYPANDAGNGANNTGAYGFPVIHNPSYLDVYGLFFGAGSTQINIFGNGGGDYEFTWTTPGGSGGATTGGRFSLTPVPEPASLTLLGLGAAGLLGVAWRRRRAAPAGATA